MFGLPSLRCLAHCRLALIVSVLTLAIGSGSLTSNASAQNTQRSPADTVREFYKALREHRFKDAWALTIYKPAVQDLTVEEMEDLRPGFEEQAAEIPPQVEIMGEEITANIAIVFVKVPEKADTTQVTSKPLTLISSGGVWIIGTEADQAVVKKAGRRYFLDALIDGNHGAMEDLLKRLIAVQIAYSLQHNGSFGDLKALIAATLMPQELENTDSTGYRFHITVAPDGKSYVAGAEPARYGHTGKLSYWMDQTGAIKSADTKGQPMTPPKQ